MKTLITGIFSLVIIWSACRNDVLSGVGTPEGTTYIEPTDQRSGDAGKGYDYITTGNYVSSGIPLGIYKLAFGSSAKEDLNRTGDNSGISYIFTVSTASNDVKIVSNNCFSCHAEHLNGQLVVGLGNNTGDNTNDVTHQFNTIDSAVQLYGTNSPEWAAYYPFSRGFKSIAPYIQTNVRGVNPADKIFAALAGFRKSDDLTWLNTSQYTLPREVIPTDVPAWWLMKKKNALYFDGLGKGDFARLSMATALVTIKDSTEARQIDAHFPDVMAWIRTIQAPKNPNAIDATLAAQGKTVFINTCANCHGTYDAPQTYPNLLVDLNYIGTDSALAKVYFSNPQYHTWYNTSWFNQKPGAAQLLPNRGYVAPPLDGIWATAPYLHNGSVPTLDDLLNSTQRPKYWSRTFDNSDYDKVKVGWNYMVQTSKKDNQTYDTTLKGYGNGGHTFGDVLSANDRKAVIEYLKTL